MSNRRRLLIVLGVVVALAGTVAVVALFAGAFSVAGYVAETYPRASHLDQGGARAYTARQAPDAVATTITRKWKPIESYHDSSGYYLRYSDDAVMVFPRGAGSVIFVDDVDRAYRRYHSVVGSRWTYRPSPLDDGGPGDGK